MKVFFEWYWRLGNAGFNRCTATTYGEVTRPPDDGNSRGLAVFAEAHCGSARHGSSTSI